MADVKSQNKEENPGPKGMRVTFSDRAGLVFHKMRMDEKYRVKVLYSVCLVYSYTLLGWTSGQLGPVLLDLEQITNVSLELASTYILAIGLGYIIGSFLGGLLYGIFSSPFILCIASLCLTAMEISIPWSKLYGVMFCVLLLDGIFEGVVDTVANTDMVRIWGKSVESWMQAMYFMFAIGAVLSPLVTAPYLSPELPVDSHNSHVTPNVTMTGNEQLYKAYIINGSLMFVGSLLYLFMIFRHRNMITKINTPHDDAQQLRPLSTGMKILILINMGGLCLLYTALEETFSEYLMTFMVKQLSMTKIQGSQATSLFYAAFGLSRFLGIFLVNYFNPISMVCFNMCILIVFLCGLTLSGGYLSTIGMWVFAPLIGVGLSVIYPIIYTWTDEHFLLITGKISAWFVIAASIGGMINPVILGTLIEEESPMWFCYLLLVESVLFLVLYVLGLLIEHHIEEPNIQKLEDSVDEKPSAQGELSSQIAQNVVPGLRRVSKIGSRRISGFAARRGSSFSIRRQFSTDPDADGMYTIQLTSPRTTSGKVFSF